MSWFTDDSVAVSDTGGNHGSPVLAGPPPTSGGFDIGKWLTGAESVVRTARGIFGGVTGAGAIPTTNANASRPTMFGGLNPTMVLIILGAAIWYFVRKR